MNTPLHLVLLKTYYAQRNLVRPAMAEIGLSPGQPKILGYLAGHDRCLQKDLAARCEIEPATVSKLLDGMETAGLVERVAVENDKRATCIAITERGRALQTKAKERFHNIMKQELGGFSEEEAEQFLSYLSRVYYNLTGREID
jgi:DNA-binding MarR family transcriptional regulator